MRRRMYGGPNSDIAVSLSNLGVVLGDQGELAAARDYLEQALAMDRRVYGNADHPEIARRLANLGVVLSNQGEYCRRPGDYLEQALEIVAAGVWRR